jgi:hypothetical protein
MGAWVLALTTSPDMLPVGPAEPPEPDELDEPVVPDCACTCAGNSIHTAASTMALA